MRRPVNGQRALPVTAVPAAPVPAVPAVMPTPVAAMPVPVPMMSPADLFRLQMLNLRLRGDSGMNTLISRRQPTILRDRLWRQRRGLRARSQCGGAGGNSKGNFQKVAAFHDLSLFVRGE